MGGVAIQLLGTFVKPMHREGIRFVAVFALAALGLFFLWAPLGWLGLGLTICKNIIEAHQGEIGVESTVGDGSTFWFSLKAL